MEKTRVMAVSLEELEGVRGGDPWTTDDLKFFINNVIQEFLDLEGENLAKNTSFGNGSCSGLQYGRMKLQLIRDHYLPGKIS